MPDNQEATEEEVIANVAAGLTNEAPADKEEDQQPPAEPVKSEAEQTLEILASLGINKDNAAQVANLARTANQFEYLLKEDPKQFLKILKTADPNVYEKVVAVTTDEYLEMHEERGNAAPAPGAPAAPATSPEMRKLQQQVETITNVIQQAQQQTQQNAVVAGYRDKVEDVIGKINKVKDADGEMKDRFKPGELKAIKALLRDSLEQDSAATQRIYAGNYVDISRHVAKVVSEFTGEVIDRSTKEHSSRQKTQERGVKEVPSGPTLNGKVTSSNAADSWDNAEMAFANALNKGRGK